MSKTATYSLIASYTATGTPTTYTFSSIPATFTDLLLVMNIDSTGSNAGVFIGAIMETRALITLGPILVVMVRLHFLDVTQMQHILIQQ